MHRWKQTLFCGILTIGLLAGCGNVDGSQTAITVDGEAINLGTAAFTLRYQQAETTNAMQMYGLMTEGGTLWDQVFDTEEDGQTYGEQVKDSVRDTLAQSVLMRKHAGDYGVSIPEEVQSALSEAASNTYAGNAEVLQKLGTTEADVQEALELASYSTLLFDAVTAEIDTDVSDEEAAQSTFTYARVYFTAEDDEEGTKTAEAYLEEMQEFLTQAQTDPATADWTSLAAEIDEDIAVSTYTYGAEDAYFPDEVMEAAATLQDGDVYDGVIETETGYYYVIRMDAVFDEEATETQKETILSERRQTAFDETVHGWLEAADVKTTSAWDALTMTDADTWTVKAAE